jgi:hypothetical protein
MYQLPMSEKGGVALSQLLLVQTPIERTKWEALSAILLIA